MVQVKLDTIAVNGSQLTVSFTHTGMECPQAQAAVLHIHENLLSAPHAGSDTIQSNQDYQVTPGFADSVSLPLLEAVEGKCFVQVDVHVNGVAHGKFFPTASCPSASVSPSSSVSPTSSVKPSSSIEATQVVRNPPSAASVPALPIQVAVTSNSTPTLAFTGATAGNPLVLGLILLAAGSILLLSVRRRRPGSRGGRRSANGRWAAGRR